MARNSWSPVTTGSLVLNPLDYDLWLHIVGERTGHTIVGETVCEVHQHDVVYVGPLEEHQLGQSHRCDVRLFLHGLSRARFLART